MPTWNESNLFFVFKANYTAVIFLIYPVILLFFLLFTMFFHKILNGIWRAGFFTFFEKALADICHIFEVSQAMNTVRMATFWILKYIFFENFHRANGATGIRSISFYHFILVWIRQQILKYLLFLDLFIILRLFWYLTIIKRCEFFGIQRLRTLFDQTHCHITCFSTYLSNAMFTIRMCALFI